MLHVIYDGQCGFCVRSLKVCRALDVRRALRFHDANARQQVHASFPELAGADFENAMFAVAPDRRVTRGFFAFRRILWESPLMWPLIPLFYLPGSGIDRAAGVRVGRQEPAPIRLRIGRLRAAARRRDPLD